MMTNKTKLDDAIPGDVVTFSDGYVIRNERALVIGMGRVFMLTGLHKMKTRSENGSRKIIVNGRIACANEGVVYQY